MLINIDQQKLIDSLRKESTNYKKEADSLRSSLNNFSFVLREKDIQLKSKDETANLNKKLFEADLKALKRRKLGIGLSVGYGLTANGQGVFTGISLNYNLIRL